MSMITNKFKHLPMLLASLAVALSGCVSENIETEIDPPAGKEVATRMGLTLVQPKTYAEADANATADELALKSVDVYVHDANGLFIKRDHFDVTAGDFVQDATNKEVWRLATGKSITTTTGVKQVYVGVNLPATLATAIEGTNPASFEQTIAAVTELGSSEAGYAMFSVQVEKPTLVEIPDGEALTANTVNVTVARLLAKVVVKKAAALSLDIQGGKIQDLTFNTSNVNRKFFPLPDRVTFKDPNHVSPIGPGNLSDHFMKGLPAAYVGVNESGASSAAVYTTENTSAGALQTEHTYVSVKGTFVPAKIYTWAEGKLTAGGAATAGSTFYKVVADGQIYYFAESTQATEFATSKGSTVVTYTAGACYYNVFLNPVPTGDEQKYDVLRNTIYTVNITKINGLGNPSDEVDDEPIANSTALTVEVSIENWALVNQDSELTGK